MINKWLNRINPSVEILLLSKGSCENQKVKKKCKIYNNKIMYILFTFGNTAGKRTEKLQIKVFIDFCLNNILEFKFGNAKKRKASQLDASFILGSSTEECLFVVLSCDLSLKNTFEKVYIQNQVSNQRQTDRLFFSNIAVS